MPTPNSEENLDNEQTALKLITTAELILNTLVSNPEVHLSDPMTYLALQLIGPILARAAGDEPRRSMDNVIAIAEQLDVDQLRKFLLPGAK